MACILGGAPGRNRTWRRRRFAPMTRDLEALRDWLWEAGATHVGMESTGVSWRPVYAVLEGRFELIVGNARHMRNGPGRKTDMKDSEWTADLVRRSDRQELRTAATAAGACASSSRYRRKLVESQAAERKLLKLPKDRHRQAGERRQRPLRRVRPRDAPGADRRRGFGRGDGRFARGQLCRKRAAWSAKRDILVERSPRRIRRAVLQRRAPSRTRSPSSSRRANKRASRSPLATRQETLAFANRRAPGRSV